MGSLKEILANSSRDSVFPFTLFIFVKAGRPDSLKSVIE